jgi:hypothetical protein
LYVEPYEITYDTKFESPVPIWHRRPAIYFRLGSGARPAACSAADPRTREWRVAARRRSAACRSTSQCARNPIFSRFHRACIPSPCGTSPCISSPCGSVPGGPGRRRFRSARAAASSGSSASASLESARLWTAGPIDAEAWHVLYCAHQHHARVEQEQGR